MSSDINNKSEGINKASTLPSDEIVNRTLKES